jgi:beta-lactamase superfamily II metal-dependent hydrolase
MGYEIDFLPVGEESSGGDAIALRYGNLYGSRSEQTVIVIDGGYTANGEAMVGHLREYYKTDRVDLVVSTHPDQDHVTGLEVVLEELKVDQLLMHLPWKHSGSMAEARAHAFKATRWSEKLQESFQASSDLETIAKRKGVPIVEPFSGFAMANGEFRVLGPSQSYYEELLAEIQTPETEAKTASIEQLFHRLIEAGKKFVSETLHIETLSDDVETRAINNTSAICLLAIDGKKSLFTGDAGIPALEQAVGILEAEGFQPGDLGFVQIPHHGSRRNVGPSVLDRLLGPKGKTTQLSTAFVSAPTKNPENKHPSKKVTNAFHRRGYAVHATQGAGKRHHHDAPARPGWSASTPVPFYSEVEESNG